MKSFSIINKYYKFSFFLKCQIIKKQKKYRLNLDNTNYTRFTSDRLLQAIPLLDELIRYYRVELTLFASVGIIIPVSKKNSIKQKFFHIENAIVRIVSTWEYIFIILNQYIDLGLVVSNHTKHRIIEGAGYTIVPVPDGMFIRMEKVPIHKEEGEEIKSKLKKELKVITPERLIQFVKDTYQINQQLENIFDLYNSKLVDKLKVQRNQFVHTGTLGANTKIEYSEMFNQQGLFVNIEKYDIEYIEKLVDENMEILKKAIKELCELIYKDLFPNRIENKDKVYKLQLIKCNECSSGEYIPFDLLEKFKEYSLCLNCTSNDLVFLDTFIVNEIVYSEAVRNYFDRLFINDA